MTWLAPAIVVVLMLLGALFPGPPNQHEMSCADLNAELGTIRADNSTAGFVEPYANWDQTELRRFRELLDEVADRQNGEDATEHPYCALSS